MSRGRRRWLEITRGDYSQCVRSVWVGNEGRERRGDHCDLCWMRRRFVGDWDGGGGVECMCHEGSRI